MAEGSLAARVTAPEEWRTIADYPSYEISDHGRIRRNCIGKGGQAVCLSNAGTREMLRVHRMVLEAFVGPAPVGCVCAHNDGNPANNELSNLRWDTQKSNLADRIEHGTELRGARNGRVKLTEAQVLEIRRRYKRRHPVDGANKLAAEFGVTDVAIIKAFRGENWSQVT
jgi:hypothetical protein